MAATFRFIVKRTKVVNVLLSTLLPAVVTSNGVLLFAIYLNDSRNQNLDSTSLLFGGTVLLLSAFSDNNKTLTTLTEPRDGTVVASRRYCHLIQLRQVQLQQNLLT